jgi:hypothetical protein
MADAVAWARRCAPVLDGAELDVRSLFETAELQ